MHSQSGRKKADMCLKSYMVDPPQDLAEARKPLEGKISSGPGFEIHENCRQFATYQYFRW